MHAVSDDTGLKHYVPAVRLWLLWAISNRVPVGTLEEKDRALADYLAHMCYEEEKSLAQGTCTLNAVLCIFVETAGHLGESARAIQAWKRFEIQGEGAPIPWAGVGAIARWMSEQNTETGRICSDLVLISADCYLRQADWNLLFHEDISYSSTYGLSMLLGVPERGASTKTGVRQGVRPDRPGVTSIILEYHAATCKGEKLFPIEPVTFARLWRKACVSLGYEAGPPHTLRHVGPSHDAAAGYRSLDQIQVRGRWRAKTSVLRYAKSHVLIAAGAKLPEKLRIVGNAFLEKLGQPPEKALN